MPDMGKHIPRHKPPEPIAVGLGPLSAALINELIGQGLKSVRLRPNRSQAGSLAGQSRMLAYPYQPHAKRRGRPEPRPVSARR